MKNCLGVHPRSVADNTRDSAMELLRIITMFLIVLHHFTVHSGNVFANSDLSIERFWLATIQLGGKVGNNLFVLLSGYFLINSRGCIINFKRIIKYCFQVWFYSIGISIMVFLMFPETMSIRNIINSIFPLASSTWWFATSYFVLYLLHPFLNKMIYALNKKEHATLCCILMVLWCIFPTFLNLFFESSNVLWFITLYIIAAFIRIHDFQLEKRKTLFLLIYSLLFTYIATFIFIYVGSIWQPIASKAMFFYNQDKLNILLISIATFLIFKGMKMSHCSSVNKIASCAFGVYLIHEHPLFRDLLWQGIFSKAAFQESILLIPYSLVVSCVVFCLCCLIDIARQIFIERKIFSKLSIFAERIQKLIMN